MSQTALKEPRGLKGRAGKSAGWRWLPLLVLAWLGLLASPTIWADSVLTLALGNGPDGSLRFAGDLVRLWDQLDEPDAHRLGLKVLADPADRLRAVQERRAHFAIVDTASAVELIPRLNQVAAITILWPLLLHPLTRDAPQLEVGLPLAQDTWVFPGGEYAFQWLTERQRRLAPNTKGNPGMAAFSDFPGKLSLRGKTLLLVPAPYPALEIASAMEQGWELTPLASSVVQEMKASKAWVVSSLLPKAQYPNQTRVLELPATYLVMVGRVDLTPAMVRKMLESVYGRRQGKAIANPLFDALDDRMSAVFAPLMPFHPEAVVALNLPVRSP